MYHKNLVEIHNLLMLILTGMAPVFMRNFQPKILFAIATFSTALAMVVIGIFVFLQDFYPNIQHLDKFSWIPLITVVVPVLMRAIGIIPIIHSLMSEVFPTEIRTQSVGLVQSSHMISGVICLKFFPEMKNLMGLYGLFFFYGAIGITSCLWGLKTIPDNRGKSLIKVEEMYEKKVDENLGYKR